MRILKSTLLFLFAFCTILNMQSCDDECEDGGCDCPIGYIGANCENFDPTQVQILLDGGRTPLELLDDNIPVSSLYGAMYQGGLIFYVNPNNGQGMVSAKTDQSNGAAWGCLGDEISGANGEAIGTGTQNTMAILGGCPTSGIAARLCEQFEADGYTDWFLPSKDELNLMWTNLADSDGDGLNPGVGDESNLGGFEADFYWSSTEFSDTKAWFQFFTNNGNQNNDFKTNLNRVRAVRTF